MPTLPRTDEHRSAPPHRPTASLAPPDVGELAPHPAGESGAADDAGIAVTRAVLASLFGPAHARSFPVHYWNGHVEPAGAGTPGAPPFALRLVRRGALRRMLLPPTELAIAEAYVAGDVDVVGSLEAAIHLGDAIGARLQRPDALAALLPLLLALPRDEPPADVARTRFARAAGWLHARGRRGGATAIRYHYDVGNDFYALWLDSRMLYTCAYFPTIDTPLEDAQVAKLDHVCRKLRLRPGDRLLDIGCGWGALVVHAAQHYGAVGHGVTLSEAQADVGRRRIAAAGLGGRCRIDVLDYRDLPARAAYDKVSSVGVMEHVAKDAQPAYFRAAYDALVPGGLFLNHCMVSVARARPVTLGRRVRDRLWRRDAFIDKYVFPDGRMVPAAHAIASAEAAGFELRDVESLREHYAATLRHWVGRLEHRAAEATALVGDRTLRVWRLYMSAAAHGFETGSLNVVQMVLLKPGVGGRSGLPLTRNHLYHDPPPRAALSSDSPDPSRPRP